MSDEQDIEYLATICCGKTKESCLGKFDDFLKAVKRLRPIFG